MAMIMNDRCYSELIKLSTFEERFNYLRLDSTIGVDTFGFDRYLNQMFYKLDEWLFVRDEVIIRDKGCDLGVEGYEILGYRDEKGILRKPRIYIHHMIPITKEQILNRDPIIFDPEYLISCTLMTHNAIHYGDESSIIKGPIERKPFDTCPWKK